jgi:hypothetical protein
VFVLQTVGAKLYAVDSVLSVGTWVCYPLGAKQNLLPIFVQRGGTKDVWHVNTPYLTDRYSPMLTQARPLIAQNFCYLKASTCLLEEH